MHHNDRVDCPVEGCGRVGAQGIKRADNLAAHSGISTALLMLGSRPEIKFVIADHLCRLEGIVILCLCLMLLSSYKS